MTEREDFLFLVSNGVLLPADVAVVLCGQDTDVRLQAAGELLARQACRSVFLSGGREGEKGTGLLSAHQAEKRLVGMGVQRDRLFGESRSQNTREQAVEVVNALVEYGWGSLHLVASTYHMPRAFLTLLQALKEADELDRRIVPVPAWAPWWRSPVGTDDTRHDLLDRELQKIATYGEKGHVATFREGIDYIRGLEDQLEPVHAGNADVN